VTAVTSEPEATLARVRDALRTALTIDPDSPEEDVAILLPAWLVAASAPEPSREEAEAELERWREDPGSSAERAWTLGAWAYWFRPEMRSWWWWHGQVDGPSQIRIRILVEGLPYGDGDLQWLLRAAGANRVRVGRE
jgi:hypothetical protein